MYGVAIEVGMYFRVAAIIMLIDYRLIWRPGNGCCRVVQNKTSLGGGSLTLRDHGIPWGKGLSSCYDEYMTSTACLLKMRNDHRFCIVIYWAMYFM